MLNLNTSILNIAADPTPSLVISRVQTLNGSTLAVTTQQYLITGTSINLSANWSATINSDTYVAGDIIQLWFVCTFTNNGPTTRQILINGVDWSSSFPSGTLVDLLFTLKYDGTTWHTYNVQNIILSLLPNLSSYAPTANPTFTGTVIIPTVSGSSDSSTKAASTAFVQAVVAALGIGNYAPIASPALTGNPTATTQAYNDNTTKIATTAMVQAAIAYLKANLTQPKILGSSPIGTVTLGTGAGTAASSTITGNDISFQISITTGTGCAASASIAQIAFGAAYAANPRAFIQPRNANAAALAVGAQPFPSETTTYIQLNAGATPLADSTTYVWNVLIAS